MLRPLIKALCVSLLLAGAAEAATPEPLPARVNADQNGVDLVDGSLHLSATDVTIGQPGAGGLAYSRTYVTMSSGSGWRNGLIGTITNTSNRFSVSIGGQSDTFDRDPVTGGFTATEGFGTSLDFDSGTQIYSYRDVDGVLYNFDKTLAGKVDPVTANEGVLVKITTRSGEITDFNFKTATVSTLTAGRLQSVTNNYGYQLHFTYANNSPSTTTQLDTDWRRPTKVTAFNRIKDYCAPTADTCSFSITWPSATYTGGPSEIATVTDALSRTTTYTYSGGKLTAIKWPGSSSNNVTISYHASGDFAGFVSQVNRGFADWDYTYSNDFSTGTRTTTITDALGNSRGATSVFALGAVVSTRDELFRTTTYEYDDFERLKATQYPSGYRVEVDIDGRGRVTETRRKAGVFVLTTRATYNPVCLGSPSCSKPLTTTDERGQVTDYTYDTTHGGVLTITLPDPDGGGALVRPQTRFAYTTKHAIFKTASSTYSSASDIHVLEQTSSCATTTSCASGADETKTTLAYAAQTASSANANNLMPISATTAAGNGTVTTTSAFAYDNFGNLLTVDGPLSGTTDTRRYRYDLARQLVGATEPDTRGSDADHISVRTTYNSLGLPTIVELGSVSSLSDSNWAGFSALRKQETVYDAHGRPTHTKFYSNATSTVLALQQVSYDAVGRPECGALRMNSSTFASPPSSACTLATTGSFGPDRLSKTIYNAAGQPVQQLSAVGTGLEQTTVLTTYTLDGLVETVTDARGAKTTYEYDGLRRLTRTRFPDAGAPGSSSLSDYEELTYGATAATLGLVTARRLRDGTSYSYAYDNLGRLTFADVPGGTPDVTYAYDNFGRMVSASQPGHALSFAYDQLSRLTSETQPNGTVSYQYDAGGRRTRLTWPGLYVDYLWD